jgi:hypothetical protein
MNTREIGQVFLGKTGGFACRFEVGAELEHHQNKFVPARVLLNLIHTPQRTRQGLPDGQPQDEPSIQQSRYGDAVQTEQGSDMDFLAEKRQEIEKRLRDLAPLVAEHARLEQAAALLDELPASPNGAADTPSPAAAAPPARRRRAGAATAAAAVKPPRGRKKGTGKRADEALAVIRKHPGITPPEIAAKIGTRATYVYQLVSALAGEGKITKTGKGWEATKAA